MTGGRTEPLLLLGAAGWKRGRASRQKTQDPPPWGTWGWATSVPAPGVTQPPHRGHVTVGTSAAGQTTVINTLQVANSHESLAFPQKEPAKTHRLSEAQGPHVIILSHP